MCPHVTSGIDSCKSPLMLQHYLVHPVPGGGPCLPNSLAAWLFQDANRGVELRRMANKFLLSTWWFWQTMITLPYNVRVETSDGTKSLVLETIPDVKFLSSEESDYI